MPGALAELLAGQVWSLFIVFVRVGAAFSVLPGFAETVVPARIRLVIAVAITAVIAPGVSAVLPALPVEPLAMAGLIAVEAIAGLFLGLVARLILAAAQVAGVIIGFQTALASAYAFDPGTQQQGIITSSWITTLALVVMFSADLHHVLIRAVAESYALLPAGQMIDPGEFADAAVRFVARSFLLGLRMAMPFLAYATLLFVGLGLMQRLMPQMQVFFVAMPLQVTLGLILFAMGSGTAMIIYLEELERTLGGLLRLR
jgi:flagellar biosynthetic protein FliR